MKYKGNKSGLYVDEKEYGKKAPLFIKILTLIFMVCALAMLAKLAFGNALPF